jgi:signal transduction histidine kinase
MWHSLRLRVFLMMVAVLAVALGSLALFASQATTRQFQRFVAAGAEVRDERLTDALAVFYRREGSWEGVQPVVEQMGHVAGIRVVLTGPEGDVVADSSGPVTKAVPALAEASMHGIEFMGQKVGTVRVLHPPLPLPGTELAAMKVVTGPLKVPVAAGFEAFAIPAPQPRADFLVSVNRSLLWAAALAGLAAVGLTFALSRRILRPVEALTAAARRMETGDLAARVAVDGRDELGTLAHAFNAMADGLQRQERLRRTLVSDVSHELRTPLANIRGYLEALQEGVVAPTPAVLGSLVDEALLLSRLVDDLQDLSLAEAGHLTLHPAPLDVPAVVDGALQALAPRAAERDVALAAELADDLPAVAADAGRIGQVLRNLLANALTHTPAGGTVTVRAGPAAAGGLQLSVTDTGPGIPAEHLPQVFERFYRADPSRARATGGAGLGLAIVRQLVEAHGGQVRAESPPGQGARFVVVLPPAAPAAPVA